jgi:predicted N-formylglutamate amidohydrolase
VNGDVRTADVAVLYDPSRRTERDFATDWAGRLRAAGMRARRNYPYRGTSDGLVTAFRAEFPASRYLGFELEVNQGLVPDRNKFLHMLGVTLSTFLGSLRSDTSSRRRRR